MKWIFKGICIAAVVVLFVFGFGYATMSLWNWLMPAVFGLKVITYWQAIGLLVLAKILFGRMGKGGRRGCGPGGCGHRGWGHHRRGEWKKRWEDKMSTMSPEEKEKFMTGLNKCGWGKNWNNECSEEKGASEEVK